MTAHKFSRRNSSYLFHGLGHDLRPRLLREDLEHGEECEGERLELLELLEVTEELHRDGGGQHEQAHREHDQAPQLAAGSEDLWEKKDNAVKMLIFNLFRNSSANMNFHN